MLTALKQWSLKEKKYLEDNNILPLPASYVKIKFADLQELQFRKVQTFWRSIVLKDAELRTNKVVVIKTIASQVAAVADIAEKERSAITSSSNFARLICMWADPKHNVKWTNAYNEQSRGELDARDDAWDALAQEYNDFDNNVYHNF